MVGAVASVVVGNDGFESRLLFVRGFLVVGLLLRQVFLNLLNILVAFGGRGKDAGNVQGEEVALSGFSLYLHGFEKAVIGNGVVDGGRGQNGVELAPVGSGMMFLEDGFDNGFPGHCFARLELVFAFRLKIVDMEAQDIVVFDGVRNGVGVQLLLKNVFRGFPGGLLPFNLLISGIFRKDRRAGEAEELGVGKKLLDGFVVFAELRTVAFVKDEDHALFAKWFQPFLVVAFVAAVEGEAELLDGGNDYFIGVVIGEQPLHQGFGIGIFFDAVLLKAVEFLSRLPVEIFAVYHEKTFVNIRIILEQGGCLEGGECFAAAGGVPDVTVAAVLVNALHDGLDSIDLVRPHHHQLLLAGHKHHVAADHFAQSAFSQKLLGEAVEMGDLLVVFTGKLVERQITLVGIEGEVAVIVIGEVPGIGAVADDEELQEAEQCSGVTVAGVVFVVDNLLHGSARTDSQGFQLYLYHRHAIDKQDHVESMMAVIGVDAKLVDYLEGIFAPLPDVDKSVKECLAIVPIKAVALTQMTGSSENIGGDDVIKQPGKLSIAQMNPVKRFKLFAEVLLQGITVANVVTVGVFEVF